MTKYISKEESLEVSKKDFLTVAEVSKRSISQIRPDLLYRTHMNIHTKAKAENTKKLERAHKLVADELLSRGFMHHQWDRLDTKYQY